MNGKAVWKYELGAGNNEIQMPRGAELLHVEMQGGRACLWVLVERDASTVTRSLTIHGTGHTIAEPTGAFVGTFLMAGGAFVWHLFDHGEIQGNVAA